MLDALKGLTGNNKTVQKQSKDLQELVVIAREERAALSAMLTQISMRAAKLQQIGQSLERVDHHASAATGRLDEVLRRVDTVEERTRSVSHIDARIHALIDAAAEAQKAAERLTSPDGELQKHCQSVQQLSSQALETQVTLQALQKERAALEALRAELRASQAEVRQSVDAAAAVRAELDQARAAASQIAHEYGRLRELSRDAREESGVACEAVKEVKKKLGALSSSTSSRRRPRTG